MQRQTHLPLKCLFDWEHEVEIRTGGNNIAVNNKEKMWRKMIFFFLIFDCFMINLEKKMKYK